MVTRKPLLRRLRRPQRRLLVGGLLAGSMIILVGIACLLYWPNSAPVTTPNTVPTREQQYMTGSQYDGVQSRILTRASTTEKTSIEYPLTGSETINAIIHRAINQDDADFRRVVASARPGAPMQQTIDYRVVFNSDRHLSLVVTTTQTTGGSHPTHRTHFWTFDKTTGQVVTLRDLTGHDSARLQALIAKVRRQLTTTIAQRGLPSVVAERVIRADSLDSFVVTNQSTISFPFGRGTVADWSYGEVELSLPVTDVADSLQTRVAKHLFAVPAPPKPQPPKTKPTPTTTPDTPAPTPTNPTRPTPTGCAADRCIALTFDDGPGLHTSRLLDHLDQYKAKATFYVLGNKLATAQTTLQRMARAGHQIGNHTWDHPNLTQLDAAAIDQQITRTNQAIRDATGQAPTSVRPPYGATDQAVQGRLDALGMTTTLWSVDTRDWADRDSPTICRRAVAGARPGAIILLHDIHATSVEAVPCILEGLHKQGYRFVTVAALGQPTAPRP